MESDTVEVAVLQRLRLVLYRCGFTVELEAVEVEVSTLEVELEAGTVEVAAL